MISTTSDESAPRIFLIEVMGRGGFAQYAFCLARALGAAGARVCLVTTNQYELLNEADFEVDELFRVRKSTAGPIENQVPRASMGRRLGTLVFKAVGTVRGLAALRRRIRATRPEIAHFQGGSMVLMDWVLARWVWPAVRRSGGRVFFTAHNILPHERKALDRLVYRWIYSHTDGLVVHNQGNAVVLAGLQPRSAPVHVIPHGVFNHLSPSVASAKDARIKLGLGANTKVILFFGLIRAYKGLDDLIRALPSIVERHNDAKLVIAGKSYEGFSKYRSLIDAYGMSGNVATHLEYIDLRNVSLFFMAADVVSLPYKHVYDSGVARLALAYARPMVVSNTGGPAELVAAAKCGLIHEPGDIAALAHRVLELLDDPNRAEELGANGKRYAGEFLSWDSIAEKTLRAYGIGGCRSVLGAEVNEKNIKRRSRL